ncbi:IS66 family transposase [Rugamonas sp. CCM 8940]|uniref:IS66 family transposase n=1 Tax=Rugamonas sp. CCM 8940 TaxID=2765359 RepID=UPI00361F254F
MPPKPPRPDLTKLSDADKDWLIDALFARLDAVEAKLGMNSENSSMPPSSDGLAKKPKKTSSLRGKSDKKVGGQPGHKGNTLKRVAEPSGTVDHPLPGHCSRCHSALPLESAQVLEWRQVFDLPATDVEVVEHRTYTVACACGQRHDSAFPAEVSETVQYGPRVRALGVHLTQGQMLPYARAAELIAELYGLPVSPATLLAWVGEAGAALQGTADVIARQLHHAPVLCADESGLRVDGKLHWMHVAATATLTWYGLHEKRGIEAMAAHGILPKRMGVLVHDCWAPYWKLDDGSHALCNAHLLRELTYVRQLTDQTWPTELMELLLNAQRLTTTARQKQHRLDAGTVASFATVYDDIVRQGEQLHPAILKPNGKPGKQSDAHNLLRRFRAHADAILRFIVDPAVPFSNNIAERAVRMPKVKQKISGCFRTVEGANNFCRIRSCLDTLRKQGHSMLDVLYRAFIGDPIMPAA